MSADNTELLDELRALRHEIRQLRHGELVARLTDAERRAIAEHVLDGLDERYVRDLATAAGERGPNRDRPRRDYFKER